MSEWQPIETAPRDGTRLRVAHELDPSSLRDGKYLDNTHGKFVNGDWVCNAGFVCVDGTFRFAPTHWRLPTPPGDAA